MNSLKLDLGADSYHIHIEPDLLHSPLSAALIPKSAHYAIVTHQTIAELYLELIKKLLPDDSNLLIIKLPEGESTKSISYFKQVMDDCLAAGFNRNSTLIALGGGVVGDLTGFVAASLHRGCHFVQIPTSLLAQVDSSVGGKTGINHDAGKNFIGAFYQPSSVLIDPTTLQTLPKREFAAGMAEVIKYAYISNPSFFEWLHTNRHSIKQLDVKVLCEMIATCCQIKAAIVEQDQHEHGSRALLNLGHTFGHAIEHQMGYGVLLHGEAVAIGMIMAAGYAHKTLGISAKIQDNLIDLLNYFELPVRLPSKIDPEDLLASMQKDKKNKDSGITLVLPLDYGKSQITKVQDQQVLLDFIESFVNIN